MRLRRMPARRLRRLTADMVARAAQRTRRAMWIRTQGLSDSEAAHIPLSFDPRPVHGS